MYYLAIDLEGNPVACIRTKRQLARALGVSVGSLYQGLGVDYDIRIVQDKIDFEIDPLDLVRILEV